MRSHLPSAVAGLLMFVPSFALAEVTTQGTPEVIHVEAKNASVQEVLGALSSAYGLTWRSNIPLEKQINGTYDGSLPQVLGRMLEGSNFVVTNSGNTFHLVITSLAGKAPIMSAASPFTIPTQASAPRPVDIGIAITPPRPAVPFVPTRDKD